MGQKEPFQYFTLDDGGLKAIYWVQITKVYMYEDEWGRE